jgi:alpha-L-rhamnosidase
MKTKESAELFSNALWITDRRIRVRKNMSPAPMTVYRKFILKKPIKKGALAATAIGNYFFRINGERVGNEVLAPGYTSYRYRLQYQTYDVTSMLSENNDLLCVVSGGWAVGFFGFIGKAGAFGNRQMLLAQLRITYEDGTEEVIGTDSSFMVSTDGAYKIAGIYEGVSYDAAVDETNLSYHMADVASPKIHPSLIPSMGELARYRESLYPISAKESKRGGTIYDFGQNFSGVVKLQMKHTTSGQHICVKHAEVLLDGEIFTSNLRKAAAKIDYYCKGGEETFIPELTTMGFRYIRVAGIHPDDVAVSAIVVSSIEPKEDMFSCSNAMINQLQNNIIWGGRSNFVDIPTDCPQRDERMGWTGDIAVFARTACANFDMKQFLSKWLADVRLEQGIGGGIPMVVPKGKNPIPIFALAGWSDCATMVPWALYLATGDVSILKENYNMMKKLCKAENFWAHFLHFGKKKYIWKGPFQFGDWCAPNEDSKMWTKKGTWIATAYFFQTSHILRQAAQVLGNEKDALYYEKLCAGIKKSYRDVFTDGYGKLDFEFASGYICPIYFGMVEGDERQAMGDNLSRLVRENDYRISTGFLGTPYLLFALADTGHVEDAYKVLLQEECPGWMYTVKRGATTIWEKWDAIKEDGSINLAAGNGADTTSSKEFDPEDQSAPSMTSFNHYAYGAVGDFFYRRILGIEALSGGYATFQIRPVPGGGLQWAKGKASTPYGDILVHWEINHGEFRMEIHSPMECKGTVIMPDGAVHEIQTKCSTYVSKFA